MAGLIATYNYIIHDLADPRTQNWWGVSNPLLTLGVATGYVYFCTSWGPRFMANRKPYELKNTILLYNIFQVLLSMFLVYEGTSIITHPEYSLACEPIDYSDNPRALRMAGGTWFYYFAKITELLDTIFFVLRKKFNQVSFLHVYHHTLMFVCIWIGAKYFPGGHTIVFGTLNSIVHVIMYTYYLISGLGPEYQKYVWWKKHVTTIQLFQFAIILFHNSMVFFYDCAFPKAINFLCVLNATAFLYMFGKFYIKNYKQTNKSKKLLETKNGHSIASKVNGVRRKVAAEKSR